MLLIDVNKNNGWLLSEWHLVYRVGWDKICKAVSVVYSTYQNAEILINNSVKSINNKHDILSLDESSTLTIRGLSDIIKVPVMITFTNQTNIVKVVVAMANKEFSEADYKSFNLSMCQFMNSIELAMYN